MTKEIIRGGIGLRFHTNTEVNWSVHPIMIREGEEADVRDTVQIAYTQAEHIRSASSIDAPIADIAMLWLVATYQLINAEEPDDRLMYLANAMRTICGLDYFIVHQQDDGTVTIFPVNALSHDAAMEIIKERVVAGRAFGSSCALN